MEIRRELHLAPVRSTSTEASQTNGPRASNGSVSGLQLSAPARELGDLAKLVQNSSGIRQDKVDAVKRQVESGSYHINLEKLADRLSTEV